MLRVARSRVTVDVLVAAFDAGQTRSVVISINLPFKQWGTDFSGAACVAALVDRFVQHCHVIDIDADSWRQKSQAPSPKKTK